MIQLFCFPHAGASAAGYLRWRQRLPQWVQVQPVELPGRGWRMREPLQTQFSELLARVEGEVQPPRGQVFAFFGHSLGALLAFELAWRRWHSGATSPAVLLVAGSVAPSLRDPERYARALSDRELRAELAALGGTPQSVLDDAELMAFALPILRADFQVAADYRCARDVSARAGAQGEADAMGATERRIPSPIHVFGGTEDVTTPTTLAAWQRHTQGACWVDVLPGGHFFVQQQEARLLALIEKRLLQVLARRGLSSDFVRRATERAAGRDDGPGVTG